jgi:hypothetical protein
MKEFSYSIICEDVAHSTFIAELLNFISKSNPQLTFSLNYACYSPWNFKCKSDVLNYYVDVSARWFSNAKLDLLFIIVDFDDWEIAEFHAHHERLQTSLRTHVRDKSLILLPVRAIEFWLYHLKWKVENPMQTKNIDIENKDRREVKKFVYGTKKPYRELTEKIIKNIIGDFNEPWLVSRSPSFNHFYSDFKAFIKE